MSVELTDNKPGAAGSPLYTNLMVLPRIPQFPDAHVSSGDTVVHFNRLVLCEVTANVMSTCFKILGIREVPRM
ncbi:hypothetical protein Aduo_009196 [Ancylostoma duodenale]